MIECGNSNIGKKKKFEESKREEGSIFSNFFNMFFGEKLEKADKTKENSKKSKEKTPIKGENIETLNRRFNRRGILWTG